MLHAVYRVGAQHGRQQLYFLRQLDYQLLRTPRLTGTGRDSLLPYVPICIPWTVVCDLIDLYHFAEWHTPDGAW